MKNWLSASGQRKDYCDNKNDLVVRRYAHPDCRLASGENGNSSVELVIVMPILLATMLLLVQLGIYFIAEFSAQSAAQAAESTALIAGTPTRLAVGAAQKVLSVNAAHLLLNQKIEVTDLPDGTAIATVSGTVDSILAIATIHVRASRSGLIEKFRP